MTRNSEVSDKIALVQSLLGEFNAVRLRGTDWFAWATAGGSSAVLLTSEVGVAEVLITRKGAWILTDEIEARRLHDEELPAGYVIHVSAWAAPEEREEFVVKQTGGAGVMSDRPALGEQPIPPPLLQAKRRLCPSETERYQALGIQAAEAMTEAMSGAEPSWTEQELAGAGARSLLARGIHPALVLVAGSRRQLLYRHPTPTSDRLDQGAMMVFCGRRHGLYANLTRFVSFGTQSQSVAEGHHRVAEIEARVLDGCRPGSSLEEMYFLLARAYTAAGHPSAMLDHHQGGTTGYLAREVVAMPGRRECLQEGTPVAWNPSLKGAKIEDTFLLSSMGLLNLTWDPAWPTVEVHGRLRPAVLQR